MLRRTGFAPPVGRYGNSARAIYARARLNVSLAGQDERGRDLSLSLSHLFPLLRFPLLCSRRAVEDTAPEIRDASAFFDLCVITRSGFKRDAKTIHREIPEDSRLYFSDEKYLCLCIIEIRIENIK